MYLNLTTICSLGIITEVIFGITDSKRRKKAREKILKLVEELNNRGYEISNEYMPLYNSDGKGFSTFMFYEGTNINYVDGEYRYVDLCDMERKLKDANCSFGDFVETVNGKDITDDVLKIMLPKRKYEKYTKSKQNK